METQTLQAKINEYMEDIKHLRRLKKRLGVNKNIFYPIVKEIEEQIAWLGYKIYHYQQTMFQMGQDLYQPSQSLLDKVSRLLPEIAPSQSWQIVDGHQERYRDLV